MIAGRAYGRKHDSMHDKLEADLFILIALTPCTTAFQNRYSEMSPECPFKAVTKVLDPTIVIIRPTASQRLLQASSSISTLPHCGKSCPQKKGLTCGVSGSHWPKVLLFRTLVHCFLRGTLQSLVEPPVQRKTMQPKSHLRAWWVELVP